MQFARPEKVEDALTLLQQGEWAILAGGTDFYPGLRDGISTRPVLDITALTDLRKIDEKPEFWSIGALATWSDVVRADLPPSFDGLKRAAREVGSVQIQNRATVIGNICNASPAADGVPPLLTLGAIVETAASSGRRRVPLEQFILGNRRTDLRPGEFVARLLVPKTSAEGASSFMKLGARKYLVISISMTAVRLANDGKGCIKDAAICVGACSAVARRLTALEGLLKGERLSGDPAALVQHSHLSELAPIDDVRAPAAYRLEASVELVQRAISDVARQLS